MESKKPYFRKHLTQLKLLGIDIIPVENVWYKHVMYNCYGFFVLSYVIGYAVLEIIDTVNNSDNLKDVTNGLCYCSTHILGIAKIITLIVKKQKFREMLERLETNHFFAPNMERGGEEEFRLINATVVRCAKHAEAFNMIVYSIVSIRCLYALLEGGHYEEIFDKHLNSTITIYRRTLPYRIWLPIETYKSPIFEILFFIQPFTLTVYGYYIGIVDSMVYGMIIHMSTQYSILKNILGRYILIAKNLVKNDDENLRVNKLALPVGYEIVNDLSEPVQEKIQQIIHYCSKHHVYIINFCKEVEEEFSMLMLLQFLFSLYTLCFQLYQLSLTSVFSFDFISMCFYLTLLMYQLFCYCWYGNEIMVQSEQFNDVLFNSDWLALSTTTKKSLLLMMMRAQRPIKFTAGKFALLSLPTFMSIIRGSASYFMVLRQMSD